MFNSYRIIELLVAIRLLGLSKRGTKGDSSLVWLQLHYWFSAKREQKGIVHWFSLQLHYWFSAKGDSSQQLHKTMFKKDRFQHIYKTPLLQFQCVFRSHLCLRILWNCTKCSSQVGPSPDFIGLGKKLQMLEMTQASCNITICLAKNLHILGGDKNGLHHICLGWNLQNLGFEPNFFHSKYQRINFFLIVIFMGLSAVIYCALYLSGLFF